MEDKMIDRRLKYGEKTISIPFRCPESKVEELRGKVYAILDSWIISKRTVETIKDVDGILVKLETEGLKKTNFILNTENNELIEREPISTKQIASLPKDRKLVTDGGFSGLYSSSGKWYTNKVVNNQLLILEWSNIDEAKDYLDNLKK